MMHIWIQKRFGMGPLPASTRTWLCALFLIFLSVAFQHSKILVWLWLSLEVYSKRHKLFFSCCSCCSSVWSLECAFDAMSSCEAKLGPLLLGPQERGEISQILFGLRCWKAQIFHPVVTPDAKSLSWGGSGDAKSYPIPLLSHSCPSSP